ncbi:winged helix-turn-helix transcriptional regulator [Dickeya solani]|uniref:HxlR family transcriptional regulator n=1 Tax=Dickeya solani D s0432-1 TaxID=1231725 RepID=A0AAV3KAI6_9GAMM|nr:helix-turn-helix domain-containing protein [Dickeya solani]ANE75357.1 HxlR family transcriptional regulator [Dickeya solani IPO 2222]AUH09229.1 HxlR family transcriptional regulator [Dickeya solani D s0432-1]AUH13201.1 HxlR family transcriptional regulator [Dickeya solani]AYQ49906.1 putative HTH-type transcriptional regulator YtcD [Dickeya solani]AYQ54070.1 putative HTH-type transcriptional regulator YtcD [Dickeya solani]
MSKPCEDHNNRLGWAAAISSALRVLEGKWKIVIVNELMHAAGTPLRFSQLERLVPGVTQKMLIQQLKELGRDGIVQRTVYPQVPPKVEYTLTELGQRLRPAMKALIEWAEFRNDHQGVLSSAPKFEDTTDA